MTRKIFVVALLLLSFYGFSQEQPWVTKKDLAGAFTINFPGNPTHNKETVPTAKGEVTMDTYSYEPKDAAPLNFIYMLAYSTYPLEFFPEGLSELSVIDTVLNNAVQGAVNNTKGTLVSKDNIQLNGFYGKTVKINIGASYVIHMKMYLVEYTLYSIQVIYDASNEDNAMAEYFFNSFELIKTNKN